MSNLGWYQVMTTAAKRVGGPPQLASLLLGAGMLLGGGLVGGGIYVKKRIAIALSKKDDVREVSNIYIINKDGCTGEGVYFRRGDRFRLLEVDKDAGLIERIGENNNPYLVSVGFLSSISDLMVQ